MKLSTKTNRFPHTFSKARALECNYSVNVTRPCPASSGARIVSCPGGGVSVAVTREFERDNCVTSEILQSDWTIPNRAGVPRKSTKVPRPSFVRESREGLGPRLDYQRHLLPRYIGSTSCYITPTLTPPLLVSC